MLAPLASLAVSLLPNLAKRVADKVMPGVEQKLSNTVSEFLGTDDVEVAEQKLQDPKVAAQLRVKLAEIELEADRIEAAEREKRRKAELEMFKTELKDTQDARGTMVELAQSGSWLKNAPALVSLVVVLGFFGALYYLIYLLRHPAEAGTDNTTVVQIVNIAVGALTAGFATVISFWLGSSQGSRNKDDISARTQTQIAEIQERSAQATRDIVRDQTSAFRQGSGENAGSRAQNSGAGQAKDSRQFGRCAEIVFANEGGFANHPSDPRGPTNLGITRPTLSAALGSEATEEDIRLLKRDTAKRIYRSNFWNALNCEILPAGIDLVVFDFGVNAGTKAAAELLQEVVHVEKDGEIGRITTGAVASLDPAEIISAYSDGRLNHYRNQPNWPEFEAGWTRRVQEIRRTAMEMLRG